MERIKNYILLVIVLSFCACKSAEKQVAAEQDTVFENALLWKIEGKELAEPSYLYGTIHLIGTENFFWPKGTLAAFEDAESIVFEIDMEQMTDMSTQMGLLSKAFMPDGQKLSDFYTEEEYVVIETHFEKMGLPIFFLERIKPLFLTVFASNDLDLSGGLTGSSSVKSYEMELMGLATEADKETAGLETIEYQMSVFDSIPYQAQADMLLEAIRMSDEGNDMFRQMEQMYIDQKINEMVDSMAEEGGMEGYEEILLYNRNANWIPVMSEMMKKQQVFFAVGAGHLGGKGGVLDLLRDAGYKITPLSHLN